MADNTIIYRLDVDTSGTNTEQARASLEALKKKIIETELEIKKLKEETKGNGDAQIAAAGKFSQLETRLKGLRDGYQQAQRASIGMASFTEKIGAQFKAAVGPLEGFLSKLGPIGSAVGGLVGKMGSISSALGTLNTSSKATADGIGSLNKFVSSTEASAAGASKGIGGLVAGLGPVGIVAGLAGAALVEFGGELFKTAEHIELVEKKAKLLYGDAFPSIDAAARANANAIGLTRVEYLNLAASQQQVFDALGLTKDQTADLTPRLLELADGLADFSAGQLDTAGAADILKNAIQGNTKGLAQFGIPIKRSQDELANLSAQMQATGKYTKDQADALAATELVFQQVGKTIEDFGEGEKTLADQTDEINAKFREQKEELASALAPAFNTATKAAGTFFDIITAGIKGDALGGQLASAQLGAMLIGQGDIADSIGKLNDAMDQAGAKLEEEATSIKNVVNEQSVAKASIDELKTKYAELIHSRDEFNKQGKSVFAAEFQKEADLVDAELKKKEEVAAANAKVGLSYDALSAKLTLLQDARKGLGELETEALKANEKEQADLKKRLAAFDLQKTGLSDLAKANQRFIESQRQIAVVYEITTAKVKEATTQGLISQQDSQKLLLDLEVTTAQARLQAKEQLAQADGKLSEQERKNIVSLNNALLVAKKAVDDYGKAIADGVKDREAEIKIKVALQELDFTGEIAGAIAFDRLARGFNDAFTSVANDFGHEVREQLLQAAQTGTLDIDGLVKAGASVELIERVRKSFNQFRIDTETNRIQLLKKEEEAKISSVSERLGELRTQLATLSASNDQKIAVGIAVPETDLKKVADLQTDIAFLEDGVKTARLAVNVDTSELDKLAADATSFDTLKAGLSASFADAGQALGSELEAGLLFAAQSGNAIDFANLIENADLPKKSIDALHDSYRLFQLETERNKLVLVKKNDQDALAHLREELEKLTAQRDELLDKRASADIDVHIEYSDADNDELKATEEQIIALDGQTAQAEVTVNMDTKAIDDVESRLERFGGRSKKQASPLADLLGLNDETTTFLLGQATDLANNIADAYVSAQQDRIARSLALTLASIDDERDSRQEAVEADVEAGIISEEEGTQKRKEIDKAAAADRKAAQKKAFEDEKSLKRAQATINYALELGALAASSAPLGIAAPLFYAVQAGIATARYVTNLAVINNAQFAKRGTVVKAQAGQIAQGPSHDQDGIPGIVNGEHAVELQGGEAIIEKENTRLFAPLLSLANSYRGRGIAFAPADKRTLTSLVGLLLPDVVPTMTQKPRFAQGGLSVTSTPMFTYGSNTEGKPQRRFAYGGLTAPIQRFDVGGISLTPSDNTIANRRQLEQATRPQTERVVQLNGEQAQRTSVVYLSELSAKTTRQQRTIDKVSYGG